MHFARDRCAPAADLPRGIHVLAPPCDALDLDMDSVFEVAKRCFDAICPGEAFLPASAAEVRAREEEAASNVVDLTI
jgi:hypothetical protein